MKVILTCAMISGSIISIKWLLQSVSVSVSAMKLVKGILMKLLVYVNMIINIYDVWEIIYVNDIIIEIYKSEAYSVWECEAVAMWNYYYCIIFYA